MCGSSSSKAETSTVTISSSGKSELISTPSDSLIIMNLNRGYLYGSSTLNSSFDVAADVQIDSLIISDGFKLNTYNFRGDISGSGTFERTSDAKGANQTYVFTGDMSQYSGDMKFSRENDGNTFKFIGNQSGTGHITIAAGNSIAVDGAVMNNRSITSAGTFTVSGNSSFVGDVSSTGTLNVSGSASFAGDVVSTGSLSVNGSVSFEGAACSNGSLVLGADAMLTNKGSFTFGEEASINLVRAVAAEDAQRTLTYTILSSTGTGTSNFSDLSLENIIGVQAVGRDWRFNDDGTLVGVLNNNALSYSGGNLVWNTSSASFSNGSDTVAFTHGDDVTFSGNSSVTFGEALSAQRVTVANGAEVTISGATGSLSLAEAVVNGTLKLNKGGQNGAFSGNVDVYGTLSVETGDVTGWSGTDGIKSIDIFAGGEMYVGVNNNQTGAGLAINLQGGRISGVSGSNFDLGYGGAIYGYSSLSALAADTATAEAPTVSTISGTNLTLRQNHTTISVAENARLDISSGILVKGNKSDLNGEGAVPSHLQAGLVKTGAGELRLSGNNTYTQATTVAEGTLTLTGGASMASSSITVNDGALFHLATGNGLSSSVSGILSGNGTLRKTGLGSASIGGLSDSFAGHIVLQQGVLSVGSPVDISSGRELSLGMTGAVLDSNLSLGDGRLNIDYSGSGTATSLNNSALTLLGGTQLQLSSLAGGDGKTYTLLTGISSLLDKNGNTLTAGSYSINDYFDKDAPGSGFWADASLVYTADGTLQIVRHEENVQETLTFSTRQTRNLEYNYYEGVCFRDITASGSSYAYGGAIEGDTITLSNNGSVTFSGNTASGGSYGASGGAIKGNWGTITLSNNGSVTFSGNTASGSRDAWGGAIYGETITLSDNGSVTFRGNTSTSSSSKAYGGAIYGASSSTITLSSNGRVTFSGNTSTASDRVAYGGAIHGGTITLSNNGSVTFSGNTASSSSPSANGGAIYASGNLSIRNNESVLFEKNVEKSGSSYRLRSIYAGGSGDAISLSAAVGKSIEFRDSVYIASGSTVNLNADYTYLDEEGESVTIRQTGDIIFTGKYTEQHLNDLLEAAGAGRTATAQEILNSRTTEVCAMTNLYGGRLRVEEGAIYQGQGITAMEGSAATVRVQNAELSHSGYDLTFNAGTKLEVAGQGSIIGKVNMMADSLFKLEQAATLSLHETLEADAATLTVNGTALLSGSSTLNASLTLADGATLDMMSLDAGAVTLNGALTFGGQVEMGEHLMAILDEMSGWNESVTLFTGLTNLVLPVTASSEASSRVWVGDVFSNLVGYEQYYFNYVPDVGSLMVVHVPEPTTTTLGLLTLTGLALRRRRK